MNKAIKVLYKVMLRNSSASIRMKNSFIKGLHTRKTQTPDILANPLVKWCLNNNIDAKCLPSDEDRDI